MTRQHITPPGLFHCTGINSTLHLSTFKWLTKRNWLSLRSLLSHKAAPVHLHYVQIGKLKQKRGCETSKNESVAESELDTGCLTAKLFEYLNSKDRYHDTNNSPLSTPQLCKGLVLGKVTEIPSTGHICNKRKLQRKITSYCPATWWFSFFFFFLLTWNGKIQDPLHPHILVNTYLPQCFIASLFYLWILPVPKQESVLNLTELLLSFWSQRYLVAASSIC